MKIALTILLVLVLAGSGYFYYLGKVSRKGNSPGLVSQKLAPCASELNCVCTEYAPADAWHIPPIQISNADSELVSALHAVIEEMGGAVQSVHGSYIAATFESAIFGFVDDFEVRVDETSNLVHVRSASRVGRSDLGANRKRVVRFTELASRS